MFFEESGGGGVDTTEALTFCTIAWTLQVIKMKKFSHQSPPRAKNHNNDEQIPRSHEEQFLIHHEGITIEILAIGMCSSKSMFTRSYEGVTVEVLRSKVSGSE